MFSYILMIATRIAAVPLAKAIRVMIMLRISGVLILLLSMKLVGFQLHIKKLVAKHKL